METAPGTRRRGQPSLKKNKKMMIAPQKDDRLLPHFISPHFILPHFRGTARDMNYCGSRSDQCTTKGLHEAAQAGSEGIRHWARPCATMIERPVHRVGDGLSLRLRCVPHSGTQ